MANLIGSPTNPIPHTRTRVVLTRIPDSWRWARTDIAIRLVPFALVYEAAHRFSGAARWLGWSLGDLRAQLVFAAVGVPVMFAASTAVQLWLTRRRGALTVPAGLDDAAFQAGFYVVNGPIEEAVFRGFVQGGLGAAWGAPVGFLIATAAYVLYHRLGQWSWAETFATALVGVPPGLACCLLPGRPSLPGAPPVPLAPTT